MAKDNTVQLSEPNGTMNGSSKKTKHISKTSKNKKHSNSMSIEEKFNAAVDVIQNLPKNGSFQPSDQLKLRFYSLFKQAKEGPNKAPKPPFYDVVARYKWDSWTKLGDMPKEEAMQNYVNELKQIVDSMPSNGTSPEFYDKLEPIFEPETKNSNGKASSQPKLNGKNKFTKDANHSSSSDSSDSDDFSDTVDNLSLNGDSKPNLNNKENKENGQLNNNRNNCFEDCTDVNSKLQPGDLINAKGLDANYLTENYFYDCIDKSSVLNPNDIICARGETGIFSSRTSLPVNQEQSTSNSQMNQPISIDNFASDTSLYQSSGSGGDRNFNRQRSELNDIHEHLALTVLRLQQAVKSFSNRIENLEAKVNERQSSNASKRAIKKESWWSNRSTQTTVLLILWPFAAHFIISAIKKRVNK